MVLLIVASILMLTTACSGSAAENKIYDHLEKAYELEADFEKRQEELLALEKEGQELYAEIVDLEMKDMDKIEEKSQEAIAIIDQQVNEVKKKRRVWTHLKKSSKRRKNTLIKLTLTKVNQLVKICIRL